MSLTDRNRLDEEESPYLRQHADNPVNWQPWDEAALEDARERDVPIFLSVGYSACHWCHVMEDESFEDEGIAEQLNEGFVPIKVDREERPDLDSIYQTICQMVTRRGGWPLSVWLTPDGRPFYVGTYFPRESRQGMPGFGDLLENIRDSWENDREEIERRADQWTDALDDELEDVPEGGERPEGLLADAAQAALRAADREHGGFGQGGPKFPQTTRLDLLGRAFDRTGREAYLDVVRETLDAMADRGMYDHLGGGFHRYATDREWIVPHFEKMLYDNAELPKAYLAGYQLTGEERYARVVHETFAFVDREMTHPEGGFYSTLDAQSAVPASRREDDEPGEHEEGAFFVWTPEEVRDVLGEESAELFCDRYGVTESGNFEGKTVLTLSRSVESLAEEYGMDESEIRDRLEDARGTLFEAREERPRPRRDEKVLAGWNGLMISALAEGGLVLDEKYAERAVSTLEFVRDHLWDEEEQRLSRRYKDGEVKVEGYLEDYAFLARGAFDCYQATGEPSHLGFALELARAIEREFWDADRGTLYFTPSTGEELVTRPQERHDQSTPSSLGVAADVLLSLSHFAGEDAHFEEIVGTVLERQGDRIEGSPLEHTTLAMVADRFETGAVELTVAAESLPERWRDRLAETYLPGRVLARRPPTEEGLEKWLDALGLEEAPSIWAERTARDGEPTLYVCRSFTCSPPVTDVEEALSWADDLDPATSG
ncbi:thioredoxin domain-containing protein [Halalkalicoccus sp. GCM10025322]|uniref:thioredoxin domain-containing protein n=1 Tax=Halalkalicoccus TaxID=332246 RepID=UPI002F9636A2